MTNKDTPCSCTFNNSHPILFPNETIVSKLTDTYVAYLPLNQSQTSADRALDLAALSSIHKSSVYVTTQRIIIITNQSQSDPKSFCLDVLDITKLIHHKDIKKSYYWAHTILTNARSDAGVLFQLSLIFSSQTTVESFLHMIKNIQFINYLKFNLPNADTTIYDTSTNTNTSASTVPITPSSELESFSTSPRYIVTPYEPRNHVRSFFESYSDEVDYDYLPSYQESRRAVELYQKREDDLRNLAFRQTLNI